MPYTLSSAPPLHCRWTCDSLLGLLVVQRDPLQSRRCNSQIGFFWHEEARAWTILRLKALLLGTTKLLGSLNPREARALVSPCAVPLLDLSHTRRHSLPSQSASARSTAGTNLGTPGSGARSDSCDAPTSTRNSTHDAEAISSSGGALLPLPQLCKESCARPGSKGSTRHSYIAATATSHRRAAEKPVLSPTLPSPGRHGMTQITTTTTWFFGKFQNKLLLTALLTF